MENIAEVEVIRDFAEKLFADRNKEGIISFLFPETQEGIGYPNTPGSRDMFLSFLKSYCIKNSISHFYVLSEVFTAKAEDGVMPSENPDREEAFVVSHIQKGETTVQLATIHNAGPARFLGDWRSGGESAQSIWEQCL